MNSRGDRTGTTRGSVLVSKTIAELEEFVGGDREVKILVSRRSLLDINAKKQRAAAAAELDDDI